MGLLPKTREVMTLAKFQDEYNEAPLSLEEYAQGAQRIVDDEALDLKNAANELLKAQREFEHQLERFEVTVG